jgi:transposase-like protein
MNLRNKHGLIDWAKAKPYVMQRLSDGALCKDIANELGCKQNTLAYYLCTWRKAGELIPKRNFTLPDGTVKIRTKRGVQYRETKVDGKWVVTGRITEHKRKVTVPKKEVKTLPTRNIDPATIQYRCKHESKEYHGEPKLHFKFKQL